MQTVMIFLISSLGIKVNVSISIGIETTKATTILIIVIPQDITLVVAVIKTERLYRARQYKNVSSQKLAGSKSLKYFVAKYNAVAQATATGTSSKFNHFNFICKSFKKL